MPVSSTMTGYDQQDDMLKVKSVVSIRKKVFIIFLIVHLAIGVEMSMISGRAEAVIWSPANLQRSRSISSPGKNTVVRTKKMMINTAGSAF